VPRHRVPRQWPGEDFLSRATPGSHGSSSKQHSASVCSFLEERRPKPDAFRSPGTMPGWPVKDQEKNDNGLRPGECKEKQLEDAKESLRPMDEQERDAAAKADNSVTEDGKVVTADENASCGSQKKPVGHFPDPPLAPERRDKTPLDGADDLGAKAGDPPKPSGAGQQSEVEDYLASHPGGELQAPMKAGTKVMINDEGQGRLNNHLGHITSIYGNSAKGWEFMVKTEDGSKTKVAADKLSIDTGLAGEDEETLHPEGEADLHPRAPPRIPTPLPKDDD